MLKRTFKNWGITGVAHDLAAHAYVLITNIVHLLMTPQTSMEMPKVLKSIGIIMTIMRTVRCVMVLILFLSSAACSGGAKVGAEMTGKNLSDAFNWFLQSGLSSVLRDREFPIRNEFQKFDVTLGANIGFGDQPYKVVVYAHSLFMTGSLVCYERISDSGKTYEYWVKKIGSRRADVERSVQYILTESDGVATPRKIIVMSENFHEFFYLPSGVKLEFPENNQVVGMLMPWMDRERYKGTFMYKYNREKVNGAYRIVEE